MAKTEVILTHQIVGLGAESDQVKVAAGYARNFLFPQGLAVPLSSTNKRRIEALRRRRAEREAHELNTMNELAKSVSKLLCLITVKTGEDGKIFGTVTSGMIADHLKNQFDISLDKRKIHLETPIRALGEHEVELRLHADVTTKLKVRVESSTPLPPPEAAAPAGATKEEHPKTEKRGRRPETGHRKPEGAHAKGEAGEKRFHGQRPDRHGRPDKATKPDNAPKAEKAPNAEKSAAKLPKAE